MKKEKKENRRAREHSPSLLAYFEQQAVRQEGEKESEFTGANYRNVRRSVRRFLEKEKEAEAEVTAFAVGEVTREWVQNYILYMKGTHKLSKGSMDFYVRGLRAVYNRAVEEGLVAREADYPFLGMNIAVPPTLKRTLSPEEMQALMDRYREQGSAYVFPALRRNCYKAGQPVSEPTACRRINRQLNALGKLLGLSQPLTVYVARHTWASFAEASGMSISYISQGLGHSSERITRIYMKGIPSSKMDEANREMLNKMMRGEKNDGKSNDVQGGKKRCPILCKSETSGVFDKLYLLIAMTYLPANVLIIIL